MVELLNRVYARSIVKWGELHPETIVLSADLTGGCEIDGFRDRFPDRFLQMGMSEQNMVGFAAGLAREGLAPHVHTFGVFLYRRALDQVEMSVAYPSLPVRLIGFLPGVTTPGGPTHQATNDLAVMRSLPNFTILEPGDATEIEGVLDLANSIDGPVYVRMMRGELPRLFPESDAMRLSEARVLAKGTDIALFSTGLCTQEAMRVVDVLGKRGLSISHLHVTTLKPFDDPRIVEALANARYGAIAMENHTRIGGLGSCIAHMIARHKIHTQLRQVAIDDTYMQGASRSYLMRRYGIDALALLEAVEEVVEKRFNVTDVDLAAARLDRYSDEQDAMDMGGSSTAARQS